MKITEQQEFELFIPKSLLPNFIKAQSVNGDAFISKTFAVEDLTEAQAVEYGEELKQTFIQHWKDKSIRCADEPNTTR